VDGEAREVSITNGELDARARAIACMLKERGLHGERMLLLYPPGLELIAALFGCLYAGNVAVLAYPPDPGRLGRTLPRLLSMVDDAQPSALLTTSALAELSAPAFADVPSLDSLPRLTTADVDPTRAATWRDPGVRPEDLALLQYTSGSTGEPRGVMLTHANVMDNLRCAQSFVGTTAADHGVIWLPPYHDMGLIGGIFWWLHVGATATLMSPAAFLKRPARWLRAISRTKATLSGGPNFAYDMCVRKIRPSELDGVDLASWEAAWNGAETVRPETMARFAEAFRSYGFRSESFLPCYGLAETTLIVTGRSRSTTLEQHPASPSADAGAAGDQHTGSVVSCGRPMGSQRVVIVDPERRTLCAPGQAGEIWVAGPSVAAGYWNRPEESARTFHATLADGDGPFLRTGDLGFLRAGELFVTGRLKDLIVIRGRNIHPQDVERTAEASHPALRPGAGAAFAVDVDGAERLVVVQEVDPDRAGPLTEVAGGIRRAVTVAHEVRPYSVVLIESRSIPKTSSGKIQRGRTRDSLLAGDLPVLVELRDSTASEQGAPIRPTPGQGTQDGLGRMSRRAIEDWLVTELARQVDVDPEQIDVHEQFAAYGLDSAQSVAMVGDLEALLGIALPETLAWDYPSIAALAEHLAVITTDRHASRLPSGG
jgi:acyl-CoA synthetase (AMP-forming)/AMP-acid ligase II/acyl carrier protein